MSKVLGVLAVLGMLGLLRGALLYGASRWWVDRRKPIVPPPSAPEDGTWVEVETFGRSRQLQRLRVASRARHWVAALYAAVGPLTWPLLAWRYGARAATLWSLPVLAGHALVLGLVLNEKLGIAWLGLGVPVVYFLLALRLASRDHERRVAGLQRRGWHSLGCSRVLASTRTASNSPRPPSAFGAAATSPTSASLRHLTPPQR
ncbi:hypothetical protein [Ideonella sp. YS5]|uniref:hypothetical protein n=1 Tax=Ideonella sp. YS5 TaxID=3453714 RepID=UPI003EEDEE40